MRDTYENLVLTVHLVDTHSMIADILTKAMPLCRRVAPARRARADDAPLAV